MSFRARMTFLYTSLVGGILLLFGVVIYNLISVTLINQVDENLSRTAEEIIDNISVNAVGQLVVPTSPNLDLARNVYVQVWNPNRTLQSLSANIRSLEQSLDPTNQNTVTPIFNDTYIGDAHLRVLSVPLRISSRPVGTLQIAASLALIDATQKQLLTSMILGVVISMTIAGLAVSVTTFRSLAPLGSVTQTALQITRADDLSRRIPYQGPADDEIGQLIHAFNQTLSRMENLFHTQRRFVADVGHELRTPLTVIKGNVTLLRRLDNSDDEALDSIEDEVDRLTRMVRDQLLLAQAESGKLIMDYRCVELDELLLEVLQQTKVLTQGRINCRLGDFDQVQVCGDRDRLKQVMLNLIGNAIKYTPQGGEVVVGLGKVKNQARITVSDNGPGIPADELPHIFERFYRTEKSRTRSKDGKGYGLGLSIAYWITRNHDGQIDVSSQEGKGTTFVVWLPLKQGECKDQVISE